VTRRSSGSGRSISILGVCRSLEIVSERRATPEKMVWTTRVAFCRTMSSPCKDPSRDQAETARRADYLRADIMRPATIRSAVSAWHPSTACSGHDDLTWRKCEWAADWKSWGSCELTVNWKPTYLSQWRQPANIAFERSADGACWWASMT